MGMGTKILVELDGDLQGLNLKVKGGVCYQCRGLLVANRLSQVLGSVAVFRTPSAPRRSHHDRENNKTQPEAEAAEEEKETVGDDRNVTRW
ncbi:hypothetical protein FocTR4_00010162 [Fusarium oxysporum f. sp. cubense]|uniref:Uncharacterized protein n=1 Tax=Fusarium oxysporum f. sp. cubense TaxID=61366 RepID=A0A5C6T8E8_FUSOC|nr:hypothetical protein FocTR4_00010162 [Fusarium oxysporum f. sp. cubense]